MSDARWYVVHTYSGYENKVKANIEKIIENRKLHDLITHVVVPEYDVFEAKNGDKNKQVKKKLFPSYVLVKMEMTDETWYVVRNTRGVTGFVGPGSKPVPLSEDEIKALGIKSEEILVNFEIGDVVKVISGPFESSVGVAKVINIHKKTVTVNLNVFGRETPVELNFTEIQKI